MKFNKTVYIFLIILFSILIFSVYLTRPLANKPNPAEFQCLKIEDGTLQPFNPSPEQIFGMGLVYSQHIIETASEFDPNIPPPIFRKEIQTLRKGKVKNPSSKEILESILKFEPGIEIKKLEELSNLPSLLDYEVELGFVLLRDIGETEIVTDNSDLPLGFFIANDLSARTIAVLGEGKENKAEYWGVSKSFPGFLPVSEQIWIPQKNSPKGIPCINLRSFVNGEIRQDDFTANMIYTPVQMINFIKQKYPRVNLKKGDMVIMGTPGGVAMSTPRWIARLSDILKLNRFQKLSLVLKKDRSKFLKKGDKVIVKGEGIGEVLTEITDND